MSRFSPAWLALREPADIAARNKQVLAACKSAFANLESLAICDIGSGTGASVRAFADLLPQNQNWTLVDHDADNLAAALLALKQWADTATLTETGLTLRHGHREITVQTLLCDISAKPNCWLADTDLVTASALFDLTSEKWIAQFATSLRASNLPLLATLTFDGVIRSEPPHESDNAIRDSFLLHQKRDKGFGPAAGANAAGSVERELIKQGYTLTHGNSPWLIDCSAQALLDETLDGIANAVNEIGQMTQPKVMHWRRKAEGSIHALTIGHRDVFAQLS